MERVRKVSQVLYTLLHLIHLTSACFVACPNHNDTQKTSREDSRNDLFLMLVVVPRFAVSVAPCLACMIYYMGNAQVNHQPKPTSISHAALCSPHGDQERCQSRRVQRAMARSSIGLGLTARKGQKPFTPSSWPLLCFHDSSTHPTSPPRVHARTSLPRPFHLLRTYKRHHDGNKRGGAGAAVDAQGVHPERVSVRSFCIPRTHAYSRTRPRYV